MKDRANPAARIDAFDATAVMGSAVAMEVPPRDAILRRNDGSLVLQGGDR